MTETQMSRFLEVAREEDGMPVSAGGPPFRSLSELTQAPARQDDPPGGRTGSWTAVPFVLQLGDGRWMRIPGELFFVDGVLHKLTLPGVETRSGGDFGVTVTFCALLLAHGSGGTQALEMRPSESYVSRLTYEHGRLVGSALVTSSAEVVF